MDNEGELVRAPLISSVNYYGAICVLADVAWWPCMSRGRYSSANHTYLHVWGRRGAAGTVGGMAGGGSLAGFDGDKSRNHSDTSLLEES